MVHTHVLGLPDCLYYEGMEGGIPQFGKCILLAEALDVTGAAELCKYLETFPSNSDIHAIPLDALNNTIPFNVRLKLQLA